MKNQVVNVAPTARRPYMAKNVMTRFKREHNSYIRVVEKSSQLLECMNALNDGITLANSLENTFRRAELRNQATNAILFMLGVIFVVSGFKGDNVQDTKVCMSIGLLIACLLSYRMTQSQQVDYSQARKQFFEQLDRKMQQKRENQFKKINDCLMTLGYPALDICTPEYRDMRIYLQIRLGIIQEELKKTKINTSCQRNVIAFLQGANEENKESNLYQFFHRGGLDIASHIVKYVNDKSVPRHG